MQGIWALQKGLPQLTLAGAGQSQAGFVIRCSKRPEAEIACALAL